MRRAATLCAALLLAGGVAWGAGFAWFDQQARRKVRPPPGADGIVALTGGAARIETALHLLATGVAPLLLVTGVGKGVHLDVGALEPQVTIGHQATSTVGNAEEIAPWARAHGLRRLVVVTAGYHMPRALLEIGHALPEATLYPVPVLPPALRGVPDMATLALLANEYDKFLAVRLGLTRGARVEGP